MIKLDFSVFVLIPKRAFAVINYFKNDARHLRSRPKPNKTDSVAERKMTY